VQVTVRRTYDEQGPRAAELLRGGVAVLGFAAELSADKSDYAPAPPVRDHGLAAVPVAAEQIFTLEFFTEPALLPP
jgi:hypothetical protein